MTFSQTESSRSTVPVPKLIPGVRVSELDSSAVVPTFLLVHPNGKRWEISEDLKSVLTAIDGSADADTIARDVSEITRGRLSEAAIRRILRGMLQEMKVVEDPALPYSTCAHQYTDDARTRSVMLARVPILRGEPLRFLTRWLQLLCFPPVVAALMTAAISFQCFLFLSVRAAVLVDASGSWEHHWLFVVGCVLGSVVFHELGHASAARRAGAFVAEIGLGIYVCFPVCYTDLTCLWGLRRAQRASVDLAGMYFQFLAATSFLVQYTLTGYAPLASAAMAINATILFNLNPFLKLDGYWFVSDLLGIPNLWTKCRKLMSGDKEIGARFSSRIRWSLWAYGAFACVYLSWFGYVMTTYIATLAWGGYAHLAEESWREISAAGTPLSGVALDGLYPLLPPTVTLVSVSIILTRCLRRAIKSVLEKRKTVKREEMTNV
jgi:hypothetical protein